MNLYPTKKEILAKQITHTKNTPTIIISWKETFFRKWYTKPALIQLQEIEILIQTLNKEYTKIPVTITTGTQYKYDQTNKTIYQNLSYPSIISALHELAHHIHGPNELTACAWSIKLFKLHFPQSYNKLQWKKHLLIKQ